MMLNGVADSRELAELYVRAQPAHTQYNVLQDKRDT